MLYLKNLFDKGSLFLGGFKRFSLESVMVLYCKYGGSPRSEQISKWIKRLRAE